MFDRIVGMLSGLGLPGVFAGVFLEAVGLPFPGSVLVALTGFLSKQGEFPMSVAWLTALLGYLLGSFAAFMLGRHVGEPFIKKWGRYIRLTPERIDKAQALLQKSAPAYIIGGRFVPTIGNITPYAAGISGISIGRFLVYDMIHAVVWISLFLGVGVIFSHEWRSVIDNPWFVWGAVVFGVVLTGYICKDLLPAGSKT